MMSIAQFASDLSRARAAEDLKARADIRRWIACNPDAAEAEREAFINARWLRFRNETAEILRALDAAREAVAAHMAVQPIAWMMARKPDDAR